MQEPTSVVDQALGAGDTAEVVEPKTAVRSSDRPEGMPLRAWERHVEVEALTSDVIILLGNGPSRDAYEAELYAHHEALKAGQNPDPIADQVWTVGSGAARRYPCDRVFQINDRTTPDSFKAHPLDGMGRPAPIFVPKVTEAMHAENERPDGRIWLEFPALDVLGRYRFVYHNSSHAWALCAAAYRGAKTIKLYGFDFDKGHERACVEAWFFLMAFTGINMIVPDNTTLTDAHIGRKPAGYDKIEMPNRGPRFTP